MVEDSGPGFAEMTYSLEMAQGWRQINVAWSKTDDDWILLPDVLRKAPRKRAEQAARQRF
jgi:hypothetical protein